MSVTTAMVEVEYHMTNLDHSIDPELEPTLRARPNEVYGIYSGWEFNGRVWFNGEEFCCEVWRYHVPREVITEPTLNELMWSVSSKYGAE